MPYKKLDLKNLPDDDGELQRLIEDSLRRSEDPGIISIKQLPLQRKVRLRPDHEFQLALPAQRKAALVQGRGNVAATTCDHCKANEGPFTECIILDEYIGGGCANCYGARRGLNKHIKCSLATEGKKFARAR